MALFNSIWDDLKYSLRTGSMITKLMVVNFSVFVLVTLVHLIMGGFTWNQPDMQGAFDDVLHYVCIPGDLNRLVIQPWSLITHMFLHSALWHLVGNLISLNIFGNIVGDLIGDRRVLPIYLLGGLAGGVFYLISAQIGILDTSRFALGASGAVMALGGAALLLAPDYRVGLLFLGTVKVKYIVLVLVLLDLTAIAGKYDSGGPIAHIAGFVLGCLFVYQLRDGKDWSEPVNKILKRIGAVFSGRPTIKSNSKKKKAGPMKVTFVGNKGNHASDQASAQSFQEKLDSILDKIKMSGYESLTQEEKDFLYEASQK